LIIQQSLERPPLEYISALILLLPLLLHPPPHSINPILFPTCFLEVFQLVAGIENCLERSAIRTIK
jgi:hypothetical protein